MENFVVSARKYRPATFDMVVGQKSITTTLKNAIKNNHLAQAFLFTGPRGVGKTTCARILAKTINCQNLSENLEACNSCPPCISFNQSNSFNVHELDAASNNSVEGIRSLVEQVRIPPQVGKYKVYIIDEVHMLSTNAFNAFLKTLEEPPAYAKFILATTERHKIIPTILSRCQIFDFARITVEDITRHLQYVAEKENINAEYDALHVIAQKADGGLRDALSVFDQMVSFSGPELTYRQVIDNLNVLDYDYFFRVLDMMLESRHSDMLLLINDIIQKGFEGSDFITGFGEHLRNLLVCKDKATLKLIEVSNEVRQRYIEQTQNCPEEFLLKALDINNKADIQYKASSNKRLTLELSLLQTAGLLKKKDLTEEPEVISLPQPVVKQEDKPKTDNVKQNPAATDSNIRERQPVAPTMGQQTNNIVQENPPVVKEPQQQAEQPLNPPAASAPSGVRLRHTGLSLKTGSMSSADNKKSQPDEAEEINTEDRPGESFSLEEFKDIWKNLATSLQSESASLAQGMLKAEPELIAKNVLQVELDNTIQEVAFNERKQELLSRIRKHLKNYAIQVEIKVRETVIETRAYLPEEKFIKLCEKFPDVKQLQKNLDLDLLY